MVDASAVTLLDERPERTPVQLDGLRLEPLQKLTETAKSLHKSIDRWDTVTSDSAKEKHRGEMSKLGRPDWHTATVGTSTPFLYPVHLAIASRNGNERAVAVDALRSRLDDELSMALSNHIAAVRSTVHSVIDGAGRI